MKFAVRMCAFFGALVLIAAPAAPKENVAASASLKAETLADWSDLKDSILKLVNQMPAEKYNFKPAMPVPRDEDHGGALEDFGTRLMYIAQVNVRFLGMLGGKTKAPTLNESVTTKEAAMKAVAQSFDYGTALLNEQTDNTMLQTVEASFLGVSSRARVFKYLESHTRQIDGQLVLYMRLSGTEPRPVSG